MKDLSIICLVIALFIMFISYYTETKKTEKFRGYIYTLHAAINKDNHSRKNYFLAKAEECGIDVIGKRVSK